MSFTAVISANIKDFESNLQKAQSQMDAFDKKIGVSVASIGRAVEGVGKKMSILSAGLVVAGGKAFTMAADFQDAIGATDQIFKDASDTVNDWAKNLSSDFGIAKEEALKYSNLMGSMLINIGQLTEEQAAKQSAKLIELAGDLTAMYGGTTQDAVRALTGALKGNNTMLDNYGMAVNDALIKQKAFELGLSSGTGELSLQAKQAATLALIWEQTGAAQGQASREADTASGAMRAVAVEVKNLSTEIGEVLLPIITPIVAKIRDFVAALRDLDPKILEWGVKIAGVVAAIGPLLIMLGKVLQILPLIKVAIAALTGPVGLIIGAVGLLTTGLIMLSSRMKQSEGQTEKLASVNDLATESIKRETAELNMLLRIAKDENLSKSEREKAIKKLNDISPKYLGNLNLENINTDKARIATEKYTTALNDNARAKVIAEKVAKLQAERIDLEVSRTEALTKVEEAKGKAITSSREDELYLANQALKLNQGIADFAEKEISLIDNQIKKFTGLEGVIADAGESAGNTLSTFEKLVAGMTANEAIQATTSAIEDLQSKIFKLQTGILPTSNLTKDLTDANKQLSELTAGLDLLTGGQEINIDVNFNTQGIEAEANKFFKDGKFTLPEVDTSNLNLSLQKANELVVDYGSIISSGIGDIASAIGNAFAGNWDDLGADLIGAMGKLAQQFGSLLIGMGTAAWHLKTTLITKPWLAIAAGAALVALGAAASAEASKMVNNATSGGGYDQSYSGGTSSYQQATPTYAPTEFRGPYQDNYTVEFKIGTNELVGVLDMAEQRKRRL